MHRHLLIVTLGLALILVAFAGCGDETADDATPTGEEDSPKGAYESIVEGQQNDDYEQILENMTDESRPEFTFQLLRAMSQQRGQEMTPDGEVRDEQLQEELDAHFDALEEIFARHGTSLQTFRPPFRDEPKEIYAELENPGALLAEVQQWASEMPGDGAMPAIEFSGTAENVEVDGDTASATVQIGEHSGTLQFRRIDSRWYLDWIASMED